MKIRTSLQIFLNFICLCVFASILSAQKIPQAVKFAEYNDETESIQTLSEKAESFAKKLQEEPATTRGFIAYFRGSSYLNRNQRRYGNVYNYLESFSARNRNRIDEKEGLQWGGRTLNRSTFARVEFWIVPKDADYPDIRANECGLYDCPTIELKGDKTVSNTSEPQTFTASVSNSGFEEIEYNWTISAGVIIEGQGTPVIKADLSNVKDNAVKVSFKLDGVPEECVIEAALTIEITRQPELVDRFGLNLEDRITSRVDILLEQLRENPTAKGFIFNYGSPTNKNFLKIRRAQIEESFSQRPAELTNRITVITGNNRQNAETEFWISFDDKQKLMPTPTVDEKAVGVPVSKRKPTRRKS